MTDFRTIAMATALGAALASPPTALALSSGLGAGLAITPMMVAQVPHTRDRGERSEDRAGQADRSRSGTFDGGSGGYDLRSSTNDPSSPRVPRSGGGIPNE
jgi:hypothetical protein